MDTDNRKKRGFTKMMTRMEMKRRDDRGNDVNLGTSGGGRDQIGGGDEEKDT
jgi:hypothetical protein